MIKLTDIIKESETQYLETLRKKVQYLNDRADERYRQVYNHYLGHEEHGISSNPFERSRFVSHDASYSHQQALNDPTYERYKDEALRAESELRRLEKQQRLGNKKRI